MHNPYTAPSADLSPDRVDGQTYTPRMFALRGRIGRVRYLVYGVGYVGLMLCVMGLSGLVGVLAHPALGMIALVLVVPLILLNFALHVRRFNDINMSGWWSLLMLIPYLSFIPGLFLLFRQGDAAVNAYGAAPGPNPRAMVLGATAVLPTVAIAGMLAAITVPAYQDYVKRKAQAGAVQLAPAAEGAQMHD